MRRPRRKIKDMEFIKRLKSESPDFFKKIQWIGGILTTVGAILVATPIGVPITTAGLAMTLIAKLPNKQKISNEEIEQLQEEIEKLKNKDK